MDQFRLKTNKIIQTALVAMMIAISFINLIHYL